MVNTRTVFLSFASKRLHLDKKGLKSGKYLLSHHRHSFLTKGLSGKLINYKKKLEIVIGYNFSTFLFTSQKPQIKRLFSEFLQCRLKHR